MCPQRLAVEPSRRGGHAQPAGPWEAVQDGLPRLRLGVVRLVDDDDARLQVEVVAAVERLNGRDLELGPGRRRPRCGDNAVVPGQPDLVEGSAHLVDEFVAVDERQQRAAVARQAEGDGASYRRLARARGHLQADRTVGHERLAEFGHETFLVVAEFEHLDRRMQRLDVPVDARAAVVERCLVEDLGDRHGLHSGDTQMILNLLGRLAQLNHLLGSTCWHCWSGHVEYTMP